MKVSVLFGTYNRFECLKPCVESIAEDLDFFRNEVFEWKAYVADGGSTDGSREWLKSRSDCVLVEGGLDGAVKAFNAAFAAAPADTDYYVLLNDDAKLVGPALSEAIALLSKSPTMGQCAIPFKRPNESCGLRFDVQLSPFGIYANFGVIRGFLARGIAKICGGLWPPCYHTYAGDGELSNWVWKLGWSVGKLEIRDQAGQLAIGIDDLWIHDGLRTGNFPLWKLANKTFFARWPKRACRMADENMWLTSTAIEPEALTRFKELRRELAPPAI